MIIIDRQLDKLISPIKVGLVGFGYMGKAIYKHIKQYDSIVIDKVLTGQNINEDDFLTNIDAFFNQSYDIIIDATGSIEYGAMIALRSFEHGTDVLTMNAELQGTLGYILNHYAKYHNCIYSDCDGDQPGTIMNLERYVRGLGMRPIILGNIKRFEDKYRNPKTQREYSESTRISTYKNQNFDKLISFTDGTKINFEMAIVANCADTSHRHTSNHLHIYDDQNIFDAIKKEYDLNSIDDPIVDYVIYGGDISGVYVVADGSNCDPELMELYKMGPGPYYYFHTPYHLCHLEIPNSIARMVLYKDTPVECNTMNTTVAAICKRDMQVGDVVDGIGGYDLYGELIDYEACIANDILPIGLSTTTRVLNNKNMGQYLYFSDVDIESSLAYRLWEEQILLIKENKFKNRKGK